MVSDGLSPDWAGAELKIRVSAVRFCPWPLKNPSSLADIARPKRPFIGLALVLVGRFLGRRG